MSSRNAAIEPRGCWYCDGTVHFDDDGIGDCDNCTETYSAIEFIEREAEAQAKADEARMEAHLKAIREVAEYGARIDSDALAIEGAVTARLSDF